MNALAETKAVENGVAVRDAEIDAPADPVNARTDSVSKMLDRAYQRASSLEMSTDERERLTREFEDWEISTGAKGNQSLLYVEHASIRRRLLEVFGPGQWSLVVRKLWTELFITAKNEEAVRVYAECVLVVRGCYCGESIGAGTYYPNNAQQDYSDAAEAAQSEAIRRISGKSLGIGLHVWNKKWCDEWKLRQRNKPAQAQVGYRQESAQRNEPAPKQQRQTKQEQAEKVRSAANLPKDGAELIARLNAKAESLEAAGHDVAGLFDAVYPCGSINDIVSWPLAAVHAGAKAAGEWIHAMQSQDAGLVSPEQANQLVNLEEDCGPERTQEPSKLTVLEWRKRMRQLEALQAEQMEPAAF